MPEKTIAEAPAFAGPRDKARDIRHHEPFAVGSLIHDSELGREGGERILAHPRTGGAECPEQGRLPRVGQTDEADVREDLELQADLSFLARQTPLPECRRLAGGGCEGPVAAPALAATGDDEGLSWFGEVGQEAVVVEDLGSDGDLEHSILAALAAATTVGTAARPVLLAVERDAAVAPAPGADDEAGFIYELQRA